MKRTASALVLSAAATMALTACGSTDSSPVTVTESVSVTETTTVKEKPSTQASAEAPAEAPAETQADAPAADAPASEAQGKFAGPTWQVVALYRHPGETSNIPDSVAGKVHLVFGDSSLTGNTGCSQIQGRVKFLTNHRPSPADGAQQVIFEHMQLDPPAGCEGAALHSHDVMRSMLHGKYDIVWENDREVLLRRPAGEHGVDVPAIRLAR